MMDKIFILNNLSITSIYKWRKKRTDKYHRNKRTCKITKLKHKEMHAIDYV
jgi:hypothetical protein